MFRWVNLITWEVIHHALKTILQLYSTVTLRRGEKKHYTNKVDVYSFGIVLLELLTNRMPFEGMSNLQAAYAAAFKVTIIHHLLCLTLFTVYSSAYYKKPKSSSGKQIKHNSQIFMHLQSACSEIDCIFVVAGQFIRKAEHVDILSEKWLLFHQMLWTLLQITRVLICWYYMFVVWKKKKSKWGQPFQRTHQRSSLSLCSHAGWRTQTWDQTSARLFACLMHFFSLCRHLHQNLKLLRRWPTTGLPSQPHHLCEMATSFHFCANYLLQRGQVLVEHNP